jgi:type II secretory pathway pseudopilin PulG
MSARFRHSEAGFTIVEAVVAALVLTMGAIATFGMLSSATKNTYRAKQTQVALDMAQQELEALRGLTNEQVALTTTPEYNANELNPNHRISGSTFAMQRTPMTEYKTLVANGGEIWGKTGEEAVITKGVINPGPTSFTSGDVKGSIFRYVVWRNDESCPETKCPGPQDYKQVIVAVKLAQSGNLATQRGYVEVQSNFVDPLDSPSKDPIPGSGGGVVTAQQFYLTDTPCSPSGSTTRATITGNHLLHNTLGTCANGLQTGGPPNRGAPDALLTSAPPDPDPEDENNPPLYSYSNDSIFTVSWPGLQIRRDDNVGCNYVPTGVTAPSSQVHRWVTDPFAKTFKMTKSVTLEFYTRALNEELYTGKLCVFLFKRHEVGTPPVATDTLLVNSAEPTHAYWTYSREGNKKSPYWPQGIWARVRVTMTFTGSPYTILAGDRLGVALSVEKNGTGNPGVIPIMYDHPKYPTRLEVDTDTPIDGG